MNNKRLKCLVILSGGQDSTACLFWAKHNFKEVYAITYDYGQRHAREIQAAIDVAKIAGVTHHVVSVIGPILQGRSPLTNPDEQLETYDNHDQMSGVIGSRVEKTFVPMRNDLFLTLAANHAVCHDIYDLVTGVCQADNANYPDCRQEFIDAKQDSINLALGLAEFSAASSFDIHTPLMYLSKAQSIKLTIDMPRAYETLAFSHTAYDGVYPPIGTDHASILRAHGFEEAGVPDPLVVRAWSEGLMPLPTTPNYSDMEYINTLVAVIENVKQSL